jgi:hypothetical protein
VKRGFSAVKYFKLGATALVMTLCQSCSKGLEGREFISDDAGAVFRGEEAELTLSDNHYVGKFSTSGDKIRVVVGDNASYFTISDGNLVDEHGKIYYDRDKVALVSGTALLCGSDRRRKILKGLRVYLCDQDAEIVKQSWEKAVAELVKSADPSANESNLDLTKKLEAHILKSTGVDEDGKYKLLATRPGKYFLHAVQLQGDSEPPIVWFIPLQIECGKNSRVDLDEHNEFNWLSKILNSIGSAPAPSREQSESPPLIPVPITNDATSQGGGSGVAPTSSQSDNSSDGGTDRSLSTVSSQTDDGSSLVHQVLSSQQKGEYEGVTEKLTKLQSLPKPSVGDSDKASEINKEGLQFLKTKQYDLASQRFREASEKDPSDAKYLSNLGFAEMLLGQLEQAERDLVLSIQAAPYRQVAWGDLGEVFAKQGREDDAVACLLIGNTVANGDFQAFLQSLSTDEDKRIQAAGALALAKIQPNDNFPKASARTYEH